MCWKLAQGRLRDLQSTPDQGMEGAERPISATGAHIDTLIVTSPERRPFRWNDLPFRGCYWWSSKTTRTIASSDWPYAMMGIKDTHHRDVWGP